LIPAVFPAPAMTRSKPHTNPLPPQNPRVRGATEMYDSVIVCTIVHAANQSVGNAKMKTTGAGDVNPTY
jgi:hypothetical protein